MCTINALSTNFQFRVGFLSICIQAEKSNHRDPDTSTQFGRSKIKMKSTMSKGLNNEKRTKIYRYKLTMMVKKRKQYSLGWILCTRFLRLFHFTTTLHTANMFPIIPVLLSLTSPSILISSHTELFSQLYKCCPICVVCDMYSLSLWKNSN